MMIAWWYNAVGCVLARCDRAQMVDVELPEAEGCVLMRRQHSYDCRIQALFK